MRIHTDVLTSRDLGDAARVASTPHDGFVYLEASEHGSRKRRRAFEVGLEGDGTRNRRRRNPGTSWERREEKGYAATWEAWGRFLAHLFEIDPDMDATYYTSAEDFHRQTQGQFLPGVNTVIADRSRVTA